MPEILPPEEAYEIVSLRRQAQVQSLRAMDEELERLTGARQYLYANRPEEDGPEWFHFRDGSKIRGIENARKYLQELLKDAGGTIWF